MGQPGGHHPPDRVEAPGLNHRDTLVRGASRPAARCPELRGDLLVPRGTSTSPRVSARVALACAASTTLLAGLAFLGWGTSWRGLASIDPASIPMAPSTALLLLIFSGVLAGEARRWSLWRTTTASLLLVTVACAHLVTFLASLPPTLDAIFVPAPDMFSGVPTGRMSPLTAAGLLLASLSLLFAGLARGGRAFGAAGASLALGVCLLGAVVTLGYFFDAPLLHGGRVVPMAFSTGLAVVALGLGLIGLAPKDSAPLRPFTGSSARAQLLRAFLPIAPAIVVVELLFHHVKGMSPTVDAAVTSLVSAVVAAGIVSYTARGVGRELERSRLDADRLAAIVQSSSDAIYAKSLDGTLVAWNASAERLYGYAQDEAKGRSAKVLLPPGREHEMDEIIEKVTAGERIDHKETDRVRKDGSPVHVSLSESPLRDADGRIIGVSVIARDVSEKRRAEIALRESEERFRRLVEHIREIVFAGGLEGSPMAQRLTFVSPQIEAVVGRPAQDFLADPGLWGRLLHPDDIANVTMETERALAQDTSVVRFYRLRNERTGEYRWIEDTFVPDHGDDGVMRGFFVTARDITERWSMEADAERLRQRNELLLTCAGEGIYGLDLQGNVTFINPKGASLLGYGVDELLGAPMHARCHHTHADGRPFLREECPSYAAITDGEVHSVDDDVMWCKDGRAIPVEYVSTPIRDEEGSLAGAVVVFRDVSEHRRLEEVVRQSHKLEAIGRLAGGVAHDFNNILGVITGYGELMRRQIEASHPARPRLEEILRAAERAAGLTHQLLAFSRKQVIQPRILDLRELVAELDKMLHRVIGEDVELEVRQALNLGAVKADPTQLEQVILNLVANARDAMPKGGHLTIETANAGV